jgi:hypothetical protein
MKKPILPVLAACVSLLVAGIPTHAKGDWSKRFSRISTIANYRNNADIGDETVSEIVAATEDGLTLVYTDSELEQIGFVDITDPANPQPAGAVAVGGEPTSVDVLGNSKALVAVNTSLSLTNTSGNLVVVDIANVDNPSVIATLPLAGQPDSIKVSPDGQYVAVVIENERDEELCVGGDESGSPVPEDGPEEPGDITEAECETGGGAVGVIPQTSGGSLDTNDNLANPPGSLDIVDINGHDPASWNVRNVDLSGLSILAPEDPEPEFVDVNADNLAAVSLQENNFLVIVDLATGTIVAGFELGTVDLVNVDATEDGRISLSENLDGVPREPDAVAWVALPGKRDGVATANEGDLFGGSRGWSIFSTEGHVLFDTGNSFEQLAVQHGHYPEDRSENKGSEPEAIAAARFGRKDLVLVGSERGSFVAVYSLRGGKPIFEQLLAGPLGPEGLLPIPGRNLLVVSGEEDDPKFGVRSTIMIYQYADERPNYPQILSRRVQGQPIPFSALSGMAALHNGKLLAVWDSYYSESKLFLIDPRRRPAVVVAEKTITGGTGNFDPEGVAVAPDGSIWVASEGDRSGSRLNRILQLEWSGKVMQEIFLPEPIEACRALEREIDGNIDSHSAGFEGIAVLPDKNGQGYKLLVPQQRGWDYTTAECEALDDDPDGSNPEEPAFTRIWTYDPESMGWDSVPWELAPVPAHASWVGLSEITDAGDGSYVVIERDNRTGDFGELKTLVRFTAVDAADGVGADEKQVYDLLPDLTASNGWISDKPEGTAITRRGLVYLVTDNDGVEDWSGETSFLHLGKLDQLFAIDDDEDDGD